MPCRSVPSCRRPTWTAPPSVSPSSGRAGREPDVEQRIGRIHRYGQVHTAQVYNLVSADTIEGQIFLLLEGKLLEIAKTLGKLDELGQVAEDLRGQILGQLSERLSYDRLYQDGVRDPRLVRTRQELEVAIDNARAARQIVW